MKYLSINTVLQSFEGCRNKTQNKFWGMVCIIRAIGERIIPATKYSFSVEKVQTYLEELFRLEDVKKTYSTSNMWSVVFSTYWVDFVPQQMLTSKPNIFDVAAWFYRRTAFEDNITPEQIVGYFMDLLNLSTEDSKKWFSFQAVSYNFETQLYSESNLMDSILEKLSLSDSSNKTLSFEGQTFIKSNPGSLGQAPFVQTLYANQGLQKCLILTQFDFQDFYPVTNKKDNLSTCINMDTHPLQQIFYGAPGTGKSHMVNETTKHLPKENVFRTTFHPDSDYSTFVGCYKPTMRAVADKYKAVAGKDEEITYSFVPQAFLQAYVSAWNNIEEPVFLVIEEINRGNCAQIFGDLFQLLDRDNEGYSEYPSMADQDMTKYLNGKDENGQDVLTNKDGIKDGKLNLPKNLHIWATMNTSDQSLFPIDSAFKRRWEWKYIPIDTKKEEWTIKVDGTDYDWSDFLERINAKIETATSSEDKMLGFYFCKAENGIITAERFVNKVAFYLWNDVFKDYGFDDAVFNDETGKKISFRRLYANDGKPNESMVKRFLDNLGVAGENQAETALETEQTAEP